MPKYALKVDATQPEIVNGLRAFKFEVVILGKPVDLAVRRPGWPNGMFAMLECKPLTGKKPKARLRTKEQRVQSEFCAMHGVPYVTSAQEALDWLNEFERSF